MNAPHDNRPLILIVDDTPANLSVLVDLLSTHHFAVVYGRPIFTREEKRRGHRSLLLAFGFCGYLHSTGMQFPLQFILSRRTKG